MVRVCFAICFILLYSFELLAQKRLLDYESIKNWPSISSYGISRDGQYVVYSVITSRGDANLFIKTTNGLWNKELCGIESGQFSSDSRKVVFKTRRDSLGVLTLGTDSVQYISNVSRFELCGNERYIFYRIKSENGLEVLDLVSGNKKYFERVDKFQCDKGGEVAVIDQVEVKNDAQMSSVRLFDLHKWTIKNICNTTKCNGFTFSEDGKELVFVTTNAVGEQASNYLHYYCLGMDTANILADSSTLGMNGMSIISDNVFFGKDGKNLFFRIKSRQFRENSETPVSNSKVSILGFYDDSTDYARNKNNSFLAAICLEDSKRKVIRLQQPGDNGFYYMDDNCNWLLTESNIFGNRSDYKWRISSRPDLYLVSAKDGSRRLLKKRCLLLNLLFSTTGRYITFFDRTEGKWYCYDIKFQKNRDITAGITQPFYHDEDRPDASHPVDGGFGGWVGQDKFILLYGRYDIWQVDPQGILAPINITHGYGVKNHIVFRCVELGENEREIIKEEHTLILSAFDERSKDDGFFSADLDTHILRKLVLSPVVFNYRSNDLCGSRFPGPVIKAKKANVFLLTRMGQHEFPNLYVTTNFNTFTPMSDYSPQKDYNWFTSQLIHWRILNGRMAEGLLYKPENFDSSRKYPIIFYYYEKNAFALNYFINPELSQGQMNIPWYVNHGYLVFVPDIYYEIGHPGKSAYNSVVSAANFLSKYSWADSHKMGLQGHSFGGFETNYIVSHSSIFAAAAPASAIANLIEMYGEFGGGSWFFERTQGRIGAKLWQRPDLYIENSPVLSADKVKAALLIMHTQDDAIVSYGQAIQWYNDLRRLGKKVWLLSYAGEDHTLSNGENELDYSIRLNQFFDYFLKNALPPKWMIDSRLIGKEGLKDLSN